MALGLNKALQKYYSNVFVTIVRYGSQWQLYCKITKNGSLVKRVAKVFPVEGEDGLGKALEEYIDNLYDTYSFVYLSYFLNTMGQGAICGATHSDFEKNSIDIKNVLSVNVDKKWSIYASYIDINWVQNMFKNVGIDFILSPFALTHFLTKNFSSDEKPVLYYLNHEDFITISIYKQDTLIFSSFFKTSTDENLVAGDEVDGWEKAEEEKGVNNLIELDEIDEGAGDFSSLDDLDDLDDVGSSLESSEDSVAFSDIEEEKDLGHFSAQAAGEDLELYGRDLLVYKYLTTSIREFYTNRVYTSDFIDKIVIYDGYEVSSDLIELIENELMMDIEIHKIDIGEATCDMTIKEANQ